MAYRRISGNEVVHTSVQEIYKVLWVESRFSVRKGNDKKEREKIKTDRPQPNLLVKIDDSYIRRLP